MSTIGRRAYSALNRAVESDAVSATMDLVAGLVRLLVSLALGALAITGLCVAVLWYQSYSNVDLFPFYVDQRLVGVVLKGSLGLSLVIEAVMLVITALAGRQRPAFRLF